MADPQITQPTLGSGGGTGTVTSVDLSLPAFLTVSGNPITTSGTLTAVLATQAANKIFAGPATGAAAAPTFRSLVAADIPDISATYLPLAGGTLTGALSISANGAASVSPLALTGTILTGGTGTTNFPALFLQPTGTTAATTWSTSGTGLGMNFASGFAGNFLDFRVAGISSVFRVAADGTATLPGANIGSNKITMTGPVSAGSWTISGISLTKAAATFTDTSSSGTVAAQYVNAFKAPTIAANSATTFTNSYNAYFEAPVAGTNVTQTNAYALGADSLNVAGNGAASASPMSLTGTILASGTGTTNFPALFIQPTGTATATTWSTSGTGLGMNLASGFGGNFLDFHAAGAASVFKVASDGSITTNGSITATSGSLTLQSNGNISFNGRNVLTSPGAAILQLGLADAAAPVAQTLGVQSVVAGTTNTAGADFTIRGSAGTGTGVGGATVFSSAKAGSTGTAQNTFAEAFRILGTGAAVKLSGGGVTVANLPAAVQGGLAFVTDATATAITGLGLAVTGSGANKVVVYSDGTNWLIL